MYIKTQNNTFLNMDRVVCMDILKSINSYHAEIRAKADGFEFEIYGGDINDVEDAFYTIQEGLIKGASFIDFSKD
jgi:hypothetical protein